MQAIVIHAAKDLRLEDRAVGFPAAGEVRVKIATGGICGSDLHYYNHGGIGDSIRLKEPMVLGHEVSGYVDAVGVGVDKLKVGELVAVSPSRPCYNCEYCCRAQHNHCLNMRFYGSAMPFPHIQGAFQQMLIATQEQCVLAKGLSAGEAAMAEPLAVCLHATKRAGDLMGKRVLVTGSGPIGTLCVLAAQAAGAIEIVVTDLTDEALAYASTIGASRTINVMKTPDALKAYEAKKGYFDVLYECSGAARALACGVATIRPRGVVMQLGLGGDMTIPMQLMTTKELELRGSFRFHDEFANAVGLMQQGRINVGPLISHTLPLSDAVEAFQIAGDRTQAMKAQIAF